MRYGSCVFFLVAATLALGSAACSDDVKQVYRDKGVKKDYGRRDLGAGDLGATPDAPVQPPDQTLVIPDKGKPDKPQSFDKGPTPDKPKADKPPAGDLGPPPANDTCANAEALTWAGAKITKQVDTRAAKDDMDLGSSGCTQYETPGYDVFFKITLPAGKYDITLKGAGDPALYVLTSCVASACVGGSDEVGKGLSEKVTVSPTTSTNYIIGVDAYDTSEAGVYTLEVGVATTTDGGPKPEGLKVDGPKVDGPKVDAGPKPDGGPLPKIVITEIMADPAAVSDANGEWFEVYNAGTATVDLKGWKIADNGTDSHVITSSVPVPAGQYRVLGRNKNSSTNGGVTVAYEYSTFYLGNSSDEILLRDDKNNLIDSVIWTTTLPPGASRSLKNPSLDNSNVSTNWCTETTAWTGSAGDKGTPGAAAVCQ
jgi:hypothetical protein